MTPSKSSVLWRCRRGIREMDLLLQRFVENHYHGLSETEQQQFSQLLEETDMDIMDWIMQRREPPAVFATLIEKIRCGNNPVHPDSN